MVGIEMSVGALAVSVAAEFDGSAAGDGFITAGVQALKKSTPTIKGVRMFILIRSRKLEEYPIFGVWGGRTPAPYPKNWTFSGYFVYSRLIICGKKESLNRDNISVHLIH
jgi:hypothetical protein